MAPERQSVTSLSGGMTLRVPHQPSAQLPLPNNLKGQEETPLGKAQRLALLQEDFPQKAGPWSLISFTLAFFLCFINIVLAKHHLPHERGSCKQVSFQMFFFFFFLNMHLDYSNGLSLLPELKLYCAVSCMSAQEEP